MMSLDMLRCPRCGGALEAVSAALRCARCRAAYDVRDGVADLLPWSSGAPGEEWSRWREKLDKLQEWRRATWDGSQASAARQRIADDLIAEFFKFARVPESGAVLEIGCGSADLRRHVPRRRYVGLDPLLQAVPRAEGIGPDDVFVRGVGEKLPIADESFETVMICETLDHALDPAGVIREARRVLKPSGVLAVMQSVRLEMPPPPAAVRLRAAAGGLKARLLGRRGVDDADTKMHAIRQEELAALVGAELLVESGITRGSVMFLRALKQDLSAPRRPKRDVGTA